MIDDLTPNPEFLKHFYPEDLFLIPDESARQAAAAPQATSERETPVSDRFAAVTQVPEPVKPLPFASSGENRKRVAVVLNRTEAEFAAIRQNQMLMRLLAAIGMAPDDVLFVNLTGAVDDVQQLYDALPFDQAILFLNPKHPLVLKEKLKQFQPMSVKGKYVLAAAELSALETYVEQKKQLWTGLQAMFL